MEAQEIFDTVATHLFNQGQRCAIKSKTSPGTMSCVYRGPNGTKCAVGALLSDEDYRAKMDDDGMTAEMLIHSFKHLPTWFIRQNGLLTSLQRVHDNGENWFSTLALQTALNRVAGAFDLDTTHLKSLSFKDK